MLKQSLFTTKNYQKGSKKIVIKAKREKNLKLLDIINNTNNEQRLAILVPLKAQNFTIHL